MSYTDRLYWISDTQAPKNLPNAFYFCIDTQLVYRPFSSDFGPLSLGMTWKYIHEL
jgi:cell division cycle 14